MKRLASICGLAAVIGAALLMAANAQPPLGPPINIVATNAINDEFSGRLKGTSPAADTCSLPVVTGEVVQLLYADSGIFPPDLNGNPHAANPSFGATRIGENISPCLGQTGRFTVSIPKPNNLTNRIFARVFNRATLSASSFYADSQLYTMQNPAINELFIPEMTQTYVALDTGDNDTDGLNNSWEKSYTSDPNDQDTDNDGVNDYAEARAGTDLLDGDSFLELVQLIPGAGGQLNILWDSVTNRCYRIEYTTDPLNASAVNYTEVGGVVAGTGTVTHTSLAGTMIHSNAHYRVKVVNCP